MKMLLQAIRTLMHRTEVRLQNLINDAASRFDSKLDAHNPTATGSFSLGRLEGSEVGEDSHAAGREVVASGAGSHAEGYGTTASGGISHAEGQHSEANGSASHAEGTNTTASGSESHAEGWHTTASGVESHAEGRKTVASGEISHAEGHETTASGSRSHAEGYGTTASGSYSHAEGYRTVAGKYQHVQGKYNIEDADGKYAHIVGNGTANDARSNAHTLDWDGNAWYAGTVEGTALILSSPNGTRYKISVDDNGALSATAITE